jgi:hypothetical protein
MPRGRAAAAALAILLAGHLVGGGRATRALLIDQETDASTFSTAATFPDVTPPVVASSVISKTVPYLPGHVAQGGTYHVYANVTDAGSGVASVRANVSGITTGQTSVALVAGSYSIGGVAYGYRSASVTANGTLAAGAKAYTITAADVATNSVTQGGFSVNVDNTRPTGAAIATVNGGAIVGRPELGDSITFTFSEIIDPESVLPTWTGTSTSVVVRIANVAGGDTLTVRNAANSAQLPFGSVNLGGTGYLRHRNAVDDGPERRVDHDHARDTVRGHDDPGRDDDDGVDAGDRCHGPCREHLHDYRGERGGTGRR